MSLKNRKILLGITGGIAAYKSTELARQLIKAGAEVRVVLTPGAQHFVTAMTFQALTGNPVRTELFDAQHEAAMGHIELARWPDQIVIAPASANCIARLAHGLADDLLTTLALASDKPLTIAPAMNHLMWRNAATQENIKVLGGRGVKVLGPASGEQACGESGPGRMMEPLDIVAQLRQPATQNLLAHKRVLITAGPTREAIDPVRFLSNRSSGKMGIAIAEAAMNEGADVTLVHGPITTPLPRGLNAIAIESAQDMLAAVSQQAGAQDIFIATAAVADYRVAEVSEQKIKKSADEFTLKLEKNPDILATIALEYPKVFAVGFAAETQNLAQNAQEKLRKKKLDLIVANPVGRNLGFDQDDNELHAFWTDGERKFPRAGKKLLAQDLIKLIAERYQPARHN